MRVLLIVLLTLSAYANETKQLHTQYTLKKGDTVSEILHRRGLAPLYGNEEQVEKTLKLNRLTAQQAKELKQGDIILLPTFVELKKEERVVYKTIDLSETYKKKALEGEFFFTYSGRSERINYGPSKLNGSLYNNYGIKIQSDLNRFINIYNVQLSGFLGGAAEYVSDPIEEDDNGGEVKTAMNYNVFGGIYIEPIEVEAKPFIQWQYEQFDGFDIKNNDIVRRRNRLSWLGLGFKHTFYFWEQPLVIKPSISYTVVSSGEQAGDIKVDGLTGFKTHLESTFTLDNKWMLGAELSYYSFKEFEDYNIGRYMLLFGRKI